jgi:hypothetical protein
VPFDGESAGLSMVRKTIIEVVLKALDANKKKATFAIII